MVRLKSRPWWAWKSARHFSPAAGLWVYLLALAPALLWLVHSIDTMRDQEHRKALAVRAPGFHRSLALHQARDDERGSGGQARASPTRSPSASRAAAMRWPSTATPTETTISPVFMLNGDRQQPERTDARFHRQGLGHLRHRVPVLLSAPGHLLRLRGNLHQPVPRGDAGKEPALLSAVSHPARSAADWKIPGRPDRHRDHLHHGNRPATSGAGLAL